MNAAISAARARLTAQIEEYHPANAQEAQDKGFILSCLARYDDVFLRSNALCHMTASAWITNARRDRVLMAFHNIYRSWSWLGGHADGEENLLEVALREAREESGLAQVRPVSERILSLEVLTVDGHIKRGQYVSSHLHLNLTYLIEADDAHALTVKPDENSSVAWFTPEDAVAASTEAWYQENIYPKLNARLRTF